MTALAIVAIAAVAVAVLSRSGEPVAEESAGPEQPAATVLSASTTIESPELIEPLTDSEIAERFGDGVFRVEISGCGVEGSGTAFAVDSHHLVTNWHVVQYDADPILRARNGRAIPARVVGASSNPDVALLSVDEPITTTFEWVAASELSEGDHVVGMGYPVPATDFSITPGSILSFQTNGSTRVAIRTDAALDHGNSGGPLVTTSGAVAGVVTETAANEGGVQTVVLAYTADRLRETIDRFRNGAAPFVADCSASSSPLTTFPKRR